MTVYIEKGNVIKQAPNCMKVTKILVPEHASPLLT